MAGLSSRMRTRRNIRRRPRLQGKGGRRAVAGLGWSQLTDGRRGFALDHYLEERSAWVAWRGIRIVNWHRPLSTYMTLLLDAGLVLRHFAEPAPRGGDPERGAHYRRAPWFLIMEWVKPG